MAGYIELSERIVECMYEVTDRLTYYVCSRKPDHRLDEHIIVPECTLLRDQSNLCIEGRNRLQLVSIDYIFQKCKSIIFKFC